VGFDTAVAVHSCGRLDWLVAVCHTVLQFLPCPCPITLVHGRDLVLAVEYFTKCKFVGFQYLVSYIVDESVALNLFGHDLVYFIHVVFKHCRC